MFTYFFHILAGAILASVILACLSLAPWVPTRRNDLPRIKNLANLKEGELFMDLGCGDGRVAGYIAKNTNARAVGVELAIPFYLFCLARGIFRKNLSFRLNDIRMANLRQADAVFLFAQSRKKLSGRLVGKLKAELRPGSRVISYIFPIDELMPVRIDKPTEKSNAIYLYIV